MKKNLFLIVFYTMITGAVYSAEYTVMNSGNTFSPATLNINIGDTVNFTLGDMHNAVEVSQATYEANGSTSNGGFSLPLGGGSQVFDETGTYYYVCTPHASLGMKGIINVASPLATNDVVGIINDFTVFPNPAKDHLTIEFVTGDETHISIGISDIAGNHIADLSNESYIPGVHQSAYTLSDALKSGIYFLYLNTGSKTYTQKLIIQ